MIRFLQVLAVFAVAMLILRNLPGDQGADDSGARAGDAPQYLAEGATWQRFDADGAVAMSATAERLMGFSGGEKRLTALRIDQLGEDDVWSLQSPAGHQAHEDARLRLDAPVDGRLMRSGAPPATLKAATVWIDAQREQLSSDEAVTWIDGTSEARAQGFDGDWAGRSVKLRGDVNVQFVRPQG